MKLTFACEADAKDALLRFKKENDSDFYPVNGTVESFKERVKRGKKGRPAEGESLLSPGHPESRAKMSRAKAFALCNCPPGKQHIYIGFSRLVSTVSTINQQLQF